jgi:hypothetical protein
MTWDFSEVDTLTKVYPTDIRYYGHDDLGDAPELHRWRASWENDCDGYPDCIALTAHPVVKLTPKGAWVAQHAYREATKQPWEQGAPGYVWNTFGTKGRFVLNGSGMSWAKLTQEEAIAAIAYRMECWARRMVHDYRRAVAAVDTLERIRSDFSIKISRSRMSLATIKSEQITYAPPTD